MYSIYMLEEGGANVGVGMYVWAVIAVFFVLVGIGWAAKNKGWLKKAEVVLPKSQSHSSH